DAMLFLFSSMLPQASKMVWVIKKRTSRAIKRLEVGSWTHHFFWNPTEFFEVNVLNGYQERLAKVLRGFKEATAWANGTEKWMQREVLAGDARCWWLERAPTGQQDPSGNMAFTPRSFVEAPSAGDFFSNGKYSALFLNENARHLDGLPAESIDYIFTDPPYGDSIQYMELSSFFLAWLDEGDLGNLIELAKRDEITINASQAKDLTAYSNALIDAFRECHRVLKTGKFMTVTFHNTDMNIRNALITAIQGAGFVYKQAIYQPPPRPSEKSLLHKFGSPVGDYMITFMKARNGGRMLRDIPAEDVNKVMKDVMDAIFLERNAPVPYNHLLSIVDLELLRRWYIPPGTTKTLQDFLEETPDYEWTENSGWFFAPALQAPLTKDNEIYEARVKAWIRRLIDDQGGENAGLPEEAILNATLAQFKGILTPDMTFLKKMVRECRHLK
nr:DNA methyltransferase [Candidatus Sigynarchaeota archaeon]